MQWKNLQSKMKRKNKHQYQSVLDSLGFEHLPYLEILKRLRDKGMKYSTARGRIFSAWFRGVIWKDEKGNFYKVDDG